MTKKDSVLSLRTQKTLQLFSSLIRAARLERKMSQQALAERLGVSRQTISALEKGDAKVAIGTVFEAATIVGIPLLAESTQELERLSTSVGSLATLLPERARSEELELDDDF